MKLSSYVIQYSPQTRCQHCGETVRLLCRHDGNMQDYPAFYCCTHCGQTSEVGVGPVEDSLTGKKPQRLYGEVNELTDAGREIFENFLKGARPIAHELAQKNVDLRDARQVAMDAINTAFAQQITLECEKKPAAFARRAREISQAKKEGG